MISEIEKALEIALPKIAIRLQNELILAAPVDTGRLRNSIRVTSDKNTLTINLVGYALYVEFGTNPHIIRPKDKEALKFKIGKENVFAKEVHHPGTRPNPFIRNTIQNKISQIIQEEILKVTSKF